MEPSDTPDHVQAAVVEMEASFEQHNRAAESVQAELEAQIQSGLADKAGQAVEVAKLHNEAADQAAQLDKVTDACAQAVGSYHSRKAG